MAVIHFKSKNSMMFWVTLWTIVGLIYIIANGGASFPVIILWIALVMFQPILILLSSRSQSGNHKLTTSHKEYEAAVNNSTGIEKLRLKIRSNSIELGSKLKRNNDDGVAFSIDLPIMEAYIHLADIFYTLLKENCESYGSSELFDDLSDKITSNEKEEKIVSSRLFGIAFGIVLDIVAASENTKIKKTAAKNFVNSCLLDEKHKEELLKMMTSYFSYKNSATKEDWALLEKMTYALVNADVKRDSNDIADPIIIMPLKTAITYIRDNTQIKDYYIKGFKEEGLIG